MIKSWTFITAAKTWDIETDEIQVSYDVVNFYPSFLFGKAIDVVLDQLKNDFEDFKTRTKLTLKDVHQLI